MVPTNHHLEALTSMGLIFPEIAEQVHESSWLGLIFTTDYDKNHHMNRWTVLLAALSLAACGGAIMSGRIISALDCF